MKIQSIANYNQINNVSMGKRKKVNTTPDSFENVKNVQNKEARPKKKSKVFSKLLYIGAMVAGALFARNKIQSKDKEIQNAKEKANVAEKFANRARVKAEYAENEALNIAKIVEIEKQAGDNARKARDVAEEKANQFERKAKLAEKNVKVAEQRVKREKEYTKAANVRANAAERKNLELEFRLDELKRQMQDVSESANSHQERAINAELKNAELEDKLAGAEKSVKKANAAQKKSKEVIVKTNEKVIVKDKEAKALAEALRREKEEQSLRLYKGRAQRYWNQQSEIVLPPKKGTTGKAIKSAMVFVEKGLMDTNQED